jgi:hypothetical protein
LLFAVTACGSKAETDTNTEEGSQTETTTEKTTEYDIASNLRLAGGDEKLLDTDYFRITLSRGPSWDYNVDSKTSITIYNIASREADCGGRLVSIIAYDVDDKGYEVLPSYCVIGEKDGKVYIESASCPDKICVNHRKIGFEGERIVCLPNRLTVRIAKQEKAPDLTP